MMDSECESKKEEKNKKPAVFLAFLRLVLTPPFQEPLAKDMNQPARAGPAS